VLLNKREDVLFRLYAHFISPSQRQALQIALATAIRLPAQRPAHQPPTSEGAKRPSEAGRLNARVSQRPISFHEHSHQAT